MSDEAPACRRDAHAPESTRAGTVLGIGAIVMWSAFPWLIAQTAGIPPFQVLTLTFVFAATGGALWCLVRERAAARRWRDAGRVIAIVSLAFFLYHALYFFALKHAPAVEASLINYTWPLLMVAVAVWRGHARVRGAAALALLLGALAMLVVITRGKLDVFEARHAPGYAAAFGAALTWALYSVWNRGQAQLGASVLVPVSVVVACLGALAHARLETWVAPQPMQWLALAAVGLIPNGVAFWWWDSATKRGDIAALGGLAYAAPVLSTCWLLLGGQATAHWSLALAVALLLVGGALSWRATPALH
jgi:drug/metabolite transporter (DMT)-like permease